MNFGFIKFIVKFVKIKLGSEGMHLMVRHHTLHLRQLWARLPLYIFFNEYRLKGKIGVDCLGDRYVFRGGEN